MPLLSLSELTDIILFISSLFILLGCVYLTIKLRFVQFKIFSAFWNLVKIPFQEAKKEGEHSIMPHRALLTAMSTTLGIGTIVGPAIAISLGGPGALIGFLLTSFLGCAATFTEVNLSVKHRIKLESGQIMGGPMQYLKTLISPFAAKWYAICGFLLMTVWSCAQANQLAAILDSPLLDTLRVPSAITGGVVALLIFFTLMGGIKRIGAFSARLVPIMFALYVGSSLWILFANIDKLYFIFGDILYSAFTPYAMASGTLVGGVIGALRWGVFKGIQMSEAGVGTQSIPHAMAETKDPAGQATIAMLSTFTAGIVAFISGCVVLVTETWLDPNLPMGISMVAAAYQQYFSDIGVVVIAFCAILFAFGTILGNSYNGSQCFEYLTKGRYTIYYYGAMALMVFVGSIADAKVVWSYSDLVLAGLVLPHMAALILHVYKQPAKEPRRTRKQPALSPVEK
jgi:alanine or glycine:cation symporter, AGCS family